MRFKSLQASKAAFQLYTLLLRSAKPDFLKNAPNKLYRYSKIFFIYRLFNWSGIY